MTFANWGLSVLAVLIFLVAVWPGWLDETITMWTVGIASVLILVMAWICIKPCEMNKGQEEIKDVKAPAKEIKAPKAVKTDIKKASKNENAKVVKKKK